MSDTPPLSDVGVTSFPSVCPSPSGQVPVYECWSPGPGLGPDRRVSQTKNGGKRVSVTRLESTVVRTPCRRRGEIEPKSDPYWGLGRIPDLPVIPGPDP